MISHNSLEQRLNAVKLGKPIPPPPLLEDSPIEKFNQDLHKHLENKKAISIKQFFISEGYKVFNVISASILYGFGIKALFSTDWGFMGILGVGFLLNHTLTILLKLFKK